jgi:arylsulfatase A
MSSVSRREFLKSSLVAGAVASFGGATLRAAANGQQQPRSAGKPNILFILADDYGHDGVGSYGSDRHKDRTPHIDALAAGGLRFTQGYVAPLCGPTRLEFLTGRYSFRTGGLNNQVAGNVQSKNEYPIPRILKEAGYDTASTGKWRQVGETPADWGFDEYVTDNTAGGWYWQKNYTKNGKLVELTEEAYIPDIYHSFAIDFLRRHRPGGSAAGKPFFLYYPVHLIHAPIVRTPDTKPGETDPEKLYDDNIAYLDKLVGQLVTEVDHLGLRENTVILFLGDNGTVGHPSTIGSRKINGLKGSLLEGGARVLWIVNWKGVTPAGRVLNDLVDASDLLPTFAELAGAKVPTNLTYDGRSFVPQVRGQKGNPRDWIYVQLGPRWYVRDAGWKLNQAGELLDLKDAPFVEQPVAADSKDETAVAARKRLKGVLDKLNPAAGKTISPEQEAAQRQQQQQQQQARRQNRRGRAGAVSGPNQP